MNALRMFMCEMKSHARVVDFVMEQCRGIFGNQAKSANLTCYIEVESGGDVLVIVVLILLHISHAL